MEIPIKIIQASKFDLPEIGALQTSSFPAEKQQLSHILGLFVNCSGLKSAKLEKGQNSSFLF